ncbi:MAG TPA: prenyltransferase [Mycobacteriales bacterium]|nr:prenyltransferase [Mycobacteriales bacterium]
MPQPDLPAIDGLLTADDIAATAASIARAQEPSGAIPWFPGGHTDPWDHVECAMALSATGFAGEAVRAYEYLRRTQRPDGSWPAKVVGTTVHDGAAETNQCAYVAVGVWHHLLITGDDRFAWRMWPTVRRAADFVVGRQTDRGEIGWLVGADGSVTDDALLTGSSSTYQSLRCALALADWVGEPQPDWELAAGRLAHVVADHPEAFLDKRRYSMDWYYPVLGGAVRGPAGHERIAEQWDDFVVPGLGARCVSDQPWVTGAETCELVLALDTVGDRDRALALLAEVQHLRDTDGSYWTGWQFAERVNWPDEHSTWTAAAVVLAVDALSRTSPGNGIFRAERLPAGVDLIPDPVCGCSSTAGLPEHP